MVGADFVPAEGYGDPLRGTLAVRRLAQRAGARLLTRGRGDRRSRATARRGACGTTRGRRAAPGAW